MNGPLPKTYPIYTYVQVISIPFAWTHEAVSPITWNSQDWIGEIGEGYNGYYADYMLLLTFGGIPWQVNIKLFCGKLKLIFYEDLTFYISWHWH